MMSSILDTPVGKGKSTYYTMGVQEFDSNMWLAFAGAEPWPDGMPLYREFNDRTVIASEGGIECHMAIESDEPVWYRINMEVPSQAVGRVFLNGLEPGFDPVACGFELQ